MSGIAGNVRAIPHPAPPGHFVPGVATLSRLREREGAADVVAKGDAEMGVGQTSEIIPVTVKVAKSRVD